MRPSNDGLPPRQQMLAWAKQRASDAAPRLPEKLITTLLKAEPRTATALMNSRGLGQAREVLLAALKRAGLERKFIDIARAPLREREEEEPDEDEASQHSSQREDHEDRPQQSQPDRLHLQQISSQPSHQELDTLTTLHTQIQAARAQLQVDLTLFANTNAALVTQQQYIVQKVEELQASEAARLQATEYTLANIESQLQL